MENGKFTLSWEVEESNLLKFKIVAKTKGYVGLAFSYSSAPQEGFIAGVDDEGKSYAKDLYLESTGEDGSLYLNLFSIQDQQRGVHRLKSDKKMSIRITDASETEDYTVIEGYRGVQGCQKEENHTLSGKLSSYLDTN